MKQQSAAFRRLTHAALLLLFLFVAVLTAPFARAQYGSSWIARALPAVSPDRYGLATSGGASPIYLATTGVDGTLSRSMDGDTWSDVAADATAASNVVWSGTQFVVAMNDHVSISPDGLTWTAGSTIAGNANLSIESVGAARPAGATADNLIVIGWDASSFLPLVYTSSNGGTSWTKRTVPANFVSPRGIVYTGSQWVAFGYGGGLWTSATGATWTNHSQAAPTSSPLNPIGWVITSVAAHGTTLVAVGYAQDDTGFDSLTPIGSLAFSSSNNGSTWTARDVRYSGNSSLTNVVWASTNFVAAGFDGFALTSPDGVTWTSQQMPSTSYEAAVFDGKQVLAVGDAGAVASSDLLPIANFSTAAYSVFESDGGFKAYVTLSKPAATAFTLPVNVSGTASDTTDFIYAAPHTASFAVGESVKAIPITLIDNTTVESDRTIILTLGAVTGLHVGNTGTQAITIQDDDSPPTVRFTVDALHSSGDSSDPLHVTEHTGSIAVTVELSWPQTTSIDVPITTTGTATNGDYTGVPATVTFAPGETLKTFAVSINNDAVKEDDKNLTLGFDGLTGVTEGTPSTLTIMVDDDDNTSDAGRLWTLRQPTPTADEIDAMTMAGNRAIIVGEHGMVKTSDDNGVTWTERFSGINTYLYAVAAHGSTVVAGGDQTTLIVSTDGGTTWAVRDTSALPYGSINAVAWTGTTFVAAGGSYDGDTQRPLVLRSPDGIKWSAIPLPLTATGSLSAVAKSASGRVVVVGGNYNETTDTEKSLIITSDDEGVTWQDRSGAIPQGGLYGVVATSSTLIA
ncbi:MAG: hypothetical protein JWO94_1731, partial [Verrucomicrobiaceae bacterium]|nr:hypothetical protein [Verrucomicrobiaceae bacterium]